MNSKSAYSVMVSQALPSLELNGDSFEQVNSVWVLAAAVVVVVVVVVVVLDAYVCVSLILRPTALTQLSCPLSHSCFFSVKCEWKQAAHYARILCNESRWSKVCSSFSSSAVICKVFGLKCCGQLVYTAYVHTCIHTLAAKSQGNAQSLSLTTAIHCHACQREALPLVRIMCCLVSDSSTVPLVGH